MTNGDAMVKKENVSDSYLRNKEYEGNKKEKQMTLRLLKN